MKLGCVVMQVPFVWGQDFGFFFVATPYDFDVIHLEPPSSGTKACGPKTRSLTRASHTGAAWPVGQFLDRWLPKGLLGLGDGLNIE